MMLQDTQCAGICLGFLQRPCGRRCILPYGHAGRHFCWQCVTQLAKGSHEVQLCTRCVADPSAAFEMVAGPSLMSSAAPWTTGKAEGLEETANGVNSNGGNDNAGPSSSATSEALMARRENNVWQVVTMPAIDCCSTAEAVEEDVAPSDTCPASWPLPRQPDAGSLALRSPAQQRGLV